MGLVRALAAERQLRPWQKAALMEAAAQLPAADLAELERPFRLLDKSRNGAIEKGDLQVVLQEIGVPSEASAEAASPSGGARRRSFGEFGVDGVRGGHAASLSGAFSGCTVANLPEARQGPERKPGAQCGEC